MYGARDKNRPEKILQFGGGNFLRGFVDFFIDELNQRELFDGSIVIAQPNSTDKTQADLFNAQNCEYTVVLQGIEKGQACTKQKTITSVSRMLNIFCDYDEYVKIAQNPDLRFVFSNTTEAGISYVHEEKPTAGAPKSFPAKVAEFLYARYLAFEGAADKGLIFMPFELIDNNGTELKNITLQYAIDWGLPQEFIDWIETHNHFTNTSVDQIISGNPKNEIGEKDPFAVAGEIFHFLAIEAEGAVAEEINKTLPFAQAGINAVVTQDISMYKLRKVRILNGAHTMAALAALMTGKETVGEMMKDGFFVEFLRRGLYDEVIMAIKIGDSHPSLGKAELYVFTQSVFNRFWNPHINHKLASIALNSVAKFKVRVLSTISDYHSQFAKFPPTLMFSFAVLIAFYETGGNDTDEVMAFMKQAWSLPTTKETAYAVLANESFWGVDLTTVYGLADSIADTLHAIKTKGVELAYEDYTNPPS